MSQGGEACCATAGFQNHLLAGGAAGLSALAVKRDLRKEGCLGDSEISVRNMGSPGLPFDAPFPDLLEDLESMPKDLALYILSLPVVKPSWQVAFLTHCNFLEGASPAVCLALPPKHSSP